MPATPGSVYQNSNSTGSSTTLTTTATFTSGDSAAVWIKVTSGNTVTVSDSVNGTTGWTKQQGPVTVGAGDCYLYTRDSMAAGSPTVTLTTNVGDSFQALAVVPISSTGGFDTSGTIALQTSGNTRTSGTSGAPASSGVAIGFCYNDTNNNGGAVGSGYAALTGTGVTTGKFWNFTVANNFALAEQKSYASGTQAATFDFTANNTSTTGSVVALFKDLATPSNASIAWIGAAG